MKVVLFCGGSGMRLREHYETIPKPMVPIGHRPILWHLMKYYAHYGHKDFILCLGWKAEVIKNFFSNTHQRKGLDNNSNRIEDLDCAPDAEMADWKITFADTGASSNIGQRLKIVAPYLSGETSFLANYADGLADAPLPALIDFHHQNKSIASFLTVKPAQTFHTVLMGPKGQVTGMRGIDQSDVWINAGFFVFNTDIFGYIEDDENLVNEPFQRLIAMGKLFSMKYRGFWQCMDTIKDKQLLEKMCAQSRVPWKIWTQTRPRPVFVNHAT
jgi:glucose-1-phosphate cytidylyltransferase